MQSTLCQVSLGVFALFASVVDMSCHVMSCHAVNDGHALQSYGLWPQTLAPCRDGPLLWNQLV